MPFNDKDERPTSGVCQHCGGEVSEDGFAMHMAEGGEVGASIEGLTDEPVEQGEAGERMREEAFADAIKRRRRAS